jgi:hypothetical protein
MTTACTIIGRKTHAGYHDQISREQSRQIYTVYDQLSSEGGDAIGAG